MSHVPVRLQMDSLGYLQWLPLVSLDLLVFLFDSRLGTSEAAKPVARRGERCSEGTPKMAVGLRGLGGLGGLRGLRVGFDL